MTGGQWVTAAGGAVAGAIVARVLVGPVLRNTPVRLRRVNVNGAEVPASLGWVVVAAGLIGIGVVTLLAPEGLSRAFAGWVGIACAIVMLGMLGAGVFDDLRGDEAPRGFTGHLSAGRLTGGIVKIVAGLGFGLVTGLLFSRDLRAVEVALLVATSANLINLLDRAPGRAGKVALIWAILLVPWSPWWAMVASGTVGGLAAVMPEDLKGKGMLGDAGANPIGAVLGLGLALTLAQPWRWAAIAVLVGLNLASERWSFSAIIESNGVLRKIDRFGRTRTPEKT